MLHYALNFRLSALVSIFGSRHKNPKKYECVCVCEESARSDTFVVAPIWFYIPQKIIRNMK